MREREREREREMGLVIRRRSSFDVQIVKVHLRSMVCMLSL